MELNKDTDELLRLYFEGSATLEEERVLRERLKDSPSCAPPYAGTLFGLWEMAAAEKCPISAKRTITEKWGLGRNTFSRRAKKILAQNSRWLFAVTAASVLLALCLLPGGNSSDVYCYLNGKPVTSIETAREQADIAARMLQNGVMTTKSGIQPAEEVRLALEKVNAALTLIDGAGYRFSYTVGNASGHDIGSESPGCDI